MDLAKICRYFNIFLKHFLYFQPSTNTPPQVNGKPALSNGLNNSSPGSTQVVSVNDVFTIIE